MAVDESHVLVCDGVNDCVQIFCKSDGVFVWELKQAVSDGLVATKPLNISIKDDELFVTDKNNQRVVVFHG